jgi:hypothetical protein
MALLLTYYLSSCIPRLGRHISNYQTQRAAVPLRTPPFILLAQLSHFGAVLSHASGFINTYDVELGGVAVESMRILG